MEQFSPPAEKPEPQESCQRDREYEGCRQHFAEPRLSLGGQAAADNSPVVLLLRASKKGCRRLSFETVNLAQLAQ